MSDQKYIDIGKRIKEFAQNNFASVKNLTIALGIEERSLSSYISGRNKPGAKLQKKLSALGADINYIMNGDNSYNGVHMLAKGSFIPLIFKVISSSPDESLSASNISKYFFIEDFPTNNKSFCLSVIGDSMSNGNGKSINDNDIVIVDMDAPINPGDVVVICLSNGSQLIKQYIPVEKSKIKLKSFNPSFPDIEVHPKEIECIYRVMGVKTPIKRL